MVKIKIINKGEDKNDLCKSPYSFLKDDRDRFFLFEKERSWNHKENGNCRFYPKGNSNVKRKEKWFRSQQIEGKACCRGVGEHNKPYAKEAEKLYVKFFSPSLIQKISWRRNPFFIFLLWYHVQGVQAKEKRRMSWIAIANRTSCRKIILRYRNLFDRIKKHEYTCLRILHLCRIWWL